MPAVEIDERAPWVSSGLTDTGDLSRIFRFFVINSPVDGLSSRRKSLADYGWETPWRKPYSLRRQLNQIASNHDLIYSAQSYAQMDSELAKADLLTFPPADTKRERVCVYNNQGTQYLSVFYHIRNSLAHGRFDVAGDVLVMEDAGARANRGKRKCSARMVLKVSTLIGWIELIEGGERSCGL